MKAGDGAPEAALALLLERIDDADPRMPVGPAAWPALREVCRQLDGLPLSLEMAAARIPLLGVEGLRRELAHRFALLASGRRDVTARHRSLHASLNWSHGLLGQKALRGT